MQRVIYLKCETEDPSYDQRVRAVIVEAETKGSWLARPLDNPACPALVWPKFAWKEVAYDR